MNTELKLATTGCAKCVHAAKWMPSNLGTGALALTFVFGFMVLVVPNAQAQTLRTLHTFCPSLGCTDGVEPDSGPVIDAMGNLYGTTVLGGTFNSGTVFKISAKGNYRLLYSFKGAPDAGFPDYGSLIVDAKGNLYGATPYGGKNTCPQTLQIGCGTVFKIDPSGKETVLYSFKGGVDGETPLSRLLRDAKGNLYGTATFGGTGTCPSFDGCGTVFKISKARRETTLHTFDASTGDGAFPEAGLVMDAQGNLYGTTAEGGANGVGTIFKLDNSGHETILYNFKGGTDGQYPGGGLYIDTAGNLYGTTGGGGAYNKGVVFKLDANGVESVLFTFDEVHGGVPSVGMTLIADQAGNFYGTTQEGDNTGGTVFKLDPTGNVSVLYGFCKVDPCSDGTDPIGGLVMDRQGNLLGVTANGGVGVNRNMGTAFKLTP